MKFALLSVSYSGLFYAGSPLSIEQQIYKCRELGFDGLAIETKRPVACPLDLTRADRARNPARRPASRVRRNGRTSQARSITKTIQRAMILRGILPDFISVFEHSLRESSKKAEAPKFPRIRFS